MKINLPIQTPRLRLRAFTPQDRHKFFLMSQEKSLRTWIPSQVYRDEAHAASVMHLLIAQTEMGDPRLGYFVLAIELRDSRELIGHVGLSRLFDGIEIGYAIEESQQGKGLATEAVQALCNWAVKQWPIEPILGITDETNAASQRVLVKAGFALSRREPMCFQGKDQIVARFEFVAAKPADKPPTTVPLNLQN